MTYHDFILPILLNPRREVRIHEIITPFNLKMNMREFELEATFPETHFHIFSATNLFIYSNKNKSELLALEFSPRRH